MKITWATDIHLNFVEKKDRLKFYQDIIKSGSDIIVLTGDIAEADSVIKILKEIVKEINMPVYFVLGNHDYYGSNVEDVKRNVPKSLQEEELLHYLSSDGPFQLTDKSVLLGQDGWADGRHGDFYNSDVVLNDSYLITDLFQAKLISRSKLLETMQSFADNDAQRLKMDLSLAIQRYKPEKIIIATHVPPFEKACLHQGMQTDKRFLPFFSCKSSGDILMDFAASYPEIEFLVLCGHTHHKAECQLLENLNIKVGNAEYYKPQINEQIYV